MMDPAGISSTSAELRDFAGISSTSAELRDFAGISDSPFIDCECVDNVSSRLSILLRVAPPLEKIFTRAADSASFSEQHLLWKKSFPGSCGYQVSKRRIAAHLFVTIINHWSLW